ncbi:unnamed protein product [Porites lobata]|uniref:Uncharacterized protein n=1 Tax=Porites lobata TaxID=104759 RepID=A0ABN8RLT2_9CNID|nr:unnamed protein product [Porites lobata]
MWLSIIVTLTINRMDSTMLFHILLPFTLCHMIYIVIPQHCDNGEYSIFGKMLRGHIFKTIKVSTPHECLQACNNDIRCRSFNYVIMRDVCKLNNRTKEARPGDFVPDSKRYYFKRTAKSGKILFCFAVPLGSIPEIPAETCKEIKASELGQAVSGDYWFDSVLPGKIILLPCNMETEDVNECSASPSVCHVNASCQNNVGSYVCSCNTGFTGDGKTCTGKIAPFSFVVLFIQLFVFSNNPNFVERAKRRPRFQNVNECSASAPVCDVNANCQNNIGSYVCSCNAGFTGDGNTCTDINECSFSPSVCDVNANCQNNAGSYTCSCNAGFIGDGNTCEQDLSSCAALRASHTADGIYQLQTSSSSISVYCDMTTNGEGWTLVARFSNADAANWMKDSGEWWYDKTVAYGHTTVPSSNSDMISPAFWLVSGTHFKITRSDNPQTALLKTTSNCLGGQTFRSKITSYGNFRNGRVWASNKCLAKCAVQYGGQYQTTHGFTMSTCSGSVQSANYIGFWCDYSSGDGAVMMIGGGGSACSRADHGIGVTEANSANFDFSPERDFGNDGGSGTSAYSLNLWVR